VGVGMYPTPLNAPHPLTHPHPLPTHAHARPQRTGHARAWMGGTGSGWVGGLSLRSLAAPSPRPRLAALSAPCSPRRALAGRRAPSPHVPSTRTRLAALSPRSRFALASLPRCALATPTPRSRLSLASLPHCVRPPSPRPRRALSRRALSPRPTVLRPPSRSHSLTLNRGAVERERNGGETKKRWSSCPGPRPGRLGPGR
jgi:hypothetical protein